MRALVPAAAVITGGLALYFTHSVLDLVLIGDRAVRVAFVPGWPVVVSFLGMAALAVVWLTRQTRPRTLTSLPVASPIGDLVLPVFSLILVVLPYTPLLPDWLPAVQLAAGPLKWMVWLTTAGLLAWTCLQTRMVRADWLSGFTRLQAAVLIGALTTAVSAAAAARLGGTVLFPGGDEPHYLVMAQSVWRDGDLKIENNHTRGDYREYFGRELKPDYLTRGSDREIYSIHPVGMPVLMAPVYAIGGYWAVVIALVLCAATAAAMVWRFTLDATNAPGAATFAWAAIALTAPFLYNTFTVYPEIVAALAVAIAFTRALDQRSWPRSHWRWVIVGVACGALPWLSTKYAPMSATLVLIALARLNPRRARLAAAAVVLPYGLSLIAWFSFLLCPLGHAAAVGALRRSGPDECQEPRVRRARASLRPGIRGAGLRARLHPRGNRSHRNDPSRRRRASSRHRNRPRLCRAARNRWRISHLVGRSRLARPAARIWTARAGAAHRHGRAIGAGLQPTACRAPPSALGEYRRCGDARRGAARVPSQ
jgi:hypothetical protein